MSEAADDYPIATVACFDPTCGELPRRALDSAKLKVFLERLCDAGAPAVLIAASTGHGHLRTVAELTEFFQQAAKAKLGESKKMALLRPEDGFETNAILLEELSQLEYDVVFVRPGTDVDRHASDEMVAASLQPLVAKAAELELPVGVYSIPDVSGVPLTADAVAMLVRGDGGDSIVAVKVTEANYETSTKRFLNHPKLGHLKVVQGWDPHLARALRDGSHRCGVTSGPMSFAVFQYLHILDAAAKQDWQEVDLAQQAVTALFESMQDDPRKFADLQRAKFIMGLGHPLCDEVTEAQVERVFDALERVARAADRKRLILSLDLMQDSPHHDRLQKLLS
ncbi:MAG: dihydrodipicolinate synthase family protein [Rubripirellula sp.]